MTFADTGSSFVAIFARPRARDQVIDRVMVIGGAGSAETIGAKSYPEPRIWIVETST